MDGRQPTESCRGLLATLDDVFEGFDELMVEAAGLRLLARQGGAGPAVLLLHGHPRTSSSWHRVAPLLVDRGRTVVCVDLPGYGRSDKPAPTADHRPHAKRAAFWPELAGRSGVV